MCGNLLGAKDWISVTKKEGNGYNEEASTFCIGAVYSSCQEFEERC